MGVSASILKTDSVCFTEFPASALLQTSKQMEGYHSANKGPRTLSDLMNESFNFDYGIAVKDHCFACTAGAGSSCGGTLT